MAEQALVRQVDHIIIASRSWSLLSLFSDKLGLQQPWPFAVRAGNANLEFSPYAMVSADHPLRRVTSDLPWPATDSARPDAKVVGFAFESLPLDEALAELDRRGIAHGAGSPQYDPDRPDVLWWTVVDLPDLSWGAWVFLCEWGAATVDGWAARNPLSRPHQSGPLGIVGVAEITLGVRDGDAALARWDRFLAPISRLGGDAWRPGNGPAIRLIPADVNAVPSLTFAVESIDRARRFLASQDMLGESDEQELTIAAAAVQGLNLRLIERSKT